VTLMSGEEEKKLLLVVDDNPSHIHFVHSILKDDYKVRIGPTGVKAVDLAKIDPLPDLILLDVMMPDMFSRHRHSSIT
jgi:CheY-like chemotaxis protein